MIFFYLWLLKIGCEWGTLKKVRTDAYCSIRRLWIDREGERVQGRRVGREGVIFIFHFWRHNSKKWVTDDGKHHFQFPLNNSYHQTLKIQQKVFGSKFKKKAKVFFNFLARNFLLNFYVLLFCSDWGKLKIIRTDACCSICRLKTDRERGQFTKGRTEGKA